MEGPVSVSLYNGGSLQPLSAVNSEHLGVFDCGVWGQMVPDQLRLVIQQPQKYQEAINIINAVSQTKVRSLLSHVIIGIILFMTALVAAAGIPIILNQPAYSSDIRALQFIGMTIIITVMILVFYKILFFRKHASARIIRELQRAVGQANILLFEENVLMGAETNSKLLLVYVNVDGCRQALYALSQDPEPFHWAMRKYSSAYTCCLARRCFPFHPASNTGHLEGTVCFCQFVIYQLCTRKRRFYRSRRRSRRLSLYDTFP